MNLFLKIYDYFAGRRRAMWATLLCSLAIFCALMTRMEVDEDLAAFYPNQDEETEFVLSNMKAMDKIVVGVRAKEGADVGVYDLMDAGEMVADTLEKLLGEECEVTFYQDESQGIEMIRYCCTNMGRVLDDEDYERLEEQTTDSAIWSQMGRMRELMQSPLSAGISLTLPYDPLGLCGSKLEELSGLADNSGFILYDGCLVTPDLRMLVFFVTLDDDFGRTGDNAALDKKIRSVVNDDFCAEAGFDEMELLAYGAPLVALSNSNRVKKDEVITVGVAVLATIVIFLLCFRRKRTIVLVLLPVLYGMAFAGGVLGAFGAEISMIAIGLGATVCGLAMSYSIHMVTHAMHARSIRELVADMTQPMTVGSVTTIGAFVALIFTSSEILSDLGLFASLTLIGTLLFSLIFLPHFMEADGEGERTRAIVAMERFVGCDWSQSKWLVGLLGVATVVGLFTFRDTTFDNDMSKLNYRGDEWLNRSEAAIVGAMDTTEESTVIVSGKDMNTVFERSERMTEKAESMGCRVRTICPLLVQSDSLRAVREAKWASFWEGRKERVVGTLMEAAESNGFDSGAFSPFVGMLDGAEGMELPDVGEFLSTKNGAYMLYAVVEMGEGAGRRLQVDDRGETEEEIEAGSGKTEVLDELGRLEGVVVTDMGYFVRKTSDSIVDNFNLILFSASGLVALVLLLTYRRLSLVVLSMLPMCVSWVVILGFMSLLDISFNIVNIVLSTFIFGVGDDFAIFMTDGLLEKEKSGKDMLGSHKTAIMLSALALFVGLGSQAFAAHPGCRSIGMLVIPGLMVVILTSFVVQPLLFRLIKRYGKIRY